MAMKTRPMGSAQGRALHPGPAAGARRAPHGGAAATSRAHPPTQSTNLVIQVVAIGGAMLAVLVLALMFFGDTIRNRFAVVGAPGVGDGVVQAPAGSGPTVFYRDLGDGTVRVMEIDEKGTRIRGTLKRSEVPMFQEPFHNPRNWDTENGGGAVTSRSRVNALGSAFR